MVEDAYAMMQPRVQRLVDMGRLRGPVDVTARTIWAASQGALSLVHRRLPRKEIEATSNVLFDAVIRELAHTPAGVPAG